MVLALQDLLATEVTEGTKGLPANAQRTTLENVVAHNWNLLVEHLPLPAAVIKQSALEHNARWMRDFLKQSDVLLAPHGKTTMCPQLFDMQLEHGAWGITVATVQQLRVCRRFGVQRVLMANQLVGNDDIRYVASELARDPQFEFYCLVDSLAGVERLQQVLHACDRSVTLRVLVEVGLAGGRTGCRTADHAMDVAVAVEAQPQLDLYGVECYEGGIVTKDAEDDARNVEIFLQQIAVVYRECQKRELFADSNNVILSAGGSAYFDIVAKVLGDVERERVQAVVRSGCYLTHDSAFYKRLLQQVENRCEGHLPNQQGLQPALEVWAYVQSVPEPGLAILTLGKRDISHDIDLPVVEQWFRPKTMKQPQTAAEGMEIFALNDQHAYLRLPDGTQLQVGDMVSLGISHPCTTFDKWRLLWMVDDDYKVVAGLKTFF